MAENLTLASIRKTQVLEAAAKLIAEHGSSNITMVEISKASGLSKGGISHYFPSKEAILAEAFVEYTNRGLQNAKQRME